MPLSPGAGSERMRIANGILYLNEGSQRQFDLNRFAQIVAQGQAVEDITPAEQRMLEQFQHMQDYLAGVGKDILGGFATFWFLFGEETFSEGLPDSWSEDIKADWSIYCVVRAVEDRVYEIKASAGNK